MADTFTTHDLKAMTEMRIQVHDPRSEAVETGGGGEYLYDPQVFWDWDPSCAWGGPKASFLVSDIGGQQQPGWDPTMGHGVIYRLHTDNTIETLMFLADGRQACFVPSSHRRAGVTVGPAAPVLMETPAWYL